MPILVFALLVFFVVGVFFLFFHLMLGKIIRPAKPDPDKLTIYECGEPTVGSAWVQFDLRYYVVALLFVIFDVEVAFFFPWAVVFGNANELAHARVDDPRRVDSKLPTRAELTTQLFPKELPLLPGEERVPLAPDTAHGFAWLGFFDILIFFGVLMVGFAYLWRRGDLNWVRSTTALEPAPPSEAPPMPPVQSPEPEMATAGHH